MGKTPFVHVRELFKAYERGQEEEYTKKLVQRYGADYALMVLDWHEEALKEMLRALEDKDETGA